MNRFLILLTSILLITGCDNAKLKVSYTPIENNGGMAGTSFRFTGYSKNFAFQTGNVYYTDTKRQLLITNFKMLNEINDIDTFKLTIFMNGELYKDIDYLGEDVDLVSAEEFLQSIYITDFTLKSSSNPTPFNQTTKKTFKDAISIYIEYCKKGKCTEEKFNYEYY